MPAATITDTGTAPVIPPASLTDATALFLQNNSDIPFFYRHGNPVSAAGVTLGLILKPHGGTIAVTGAMAKLGVYCMHAAGAGVNKTLTWDKAVV